MTTSASISAESEARQILSAALRSGFRAAYVNMLVTVSKRLPILTDTERMDVARNYPFTIVQINQWFGAEIKE